MEKKTLIISTLALIAALGFGVTYLVNELGSKEADKPATEATETATAAKGDIVYINLDRILQEYDMANDLRSVVETKVQNIQAEVNRRGKKLEKDVTEFQEKINKGLITRSVAEAQGQKLQQQEADFNAYAAKKQEEINEEQIVMMNQLADAIKTYLDKYNETMQYAMILTNTAGAPVVTADASLDITDDVLKGLNEEYIKNKNKKE